MWSAGNEDHILFVTINQEMIAGNPHAPEGTNAEISVHLLEEFRK